MLDTILEVDYDRLWLEQMQGFDHGAGTAEYWDRRSRTFYGSCQNSNYAAELMSRMDLRPEYSVLDVGCGCGVMAIPLARRVERVTALDISSIRLEKLLNKAAAAGITNITAINQDWSQAGIGQEIDEHDIVLLSRSVHVRLSETLRKMHLAARSACYVTWHAERTDDFEVEVAEAMGKSQPLYPDYSIIYGMLRQMGISAGIDTFETANQEKYPSLQEAVLSMARGTRINDVQYGRLLGIAGNRLTRMDDGYSLTRKTKWVLISWRNDVRI